MYVNIEDTNRVIAVLVYDDLGAEAFIVRFNAQGSLPSVQRVLLYEVHVVHPNDLREETAFQKKMRINPKRHKKSLRRHQWSSRFVHFSDRAH